MNSDPTIAYFSMEIAMDPAIHTYSGGLGVLAGDTIRSAADLKVPMIAVTLLHRKGYFCQKLDENGWQVEAPDDWPVDKFVQPLEPRVTVSIEARKVQVRGWKYEVKGVTGHVVPVILLDTDLETNSEWDRHITDNLYGGDDHYRLCQEIVLGMGGVKFLRALGCQNLRRFHLNEGHAAFLAVELLDETARAAGRTEFNQQDVEAVRERCVFTTHTPVPAGHDKFAVDHVRRILGRPELDAMPDLFCGEGAVNMTMLALNTSRFVNGVAKKHAEVSRAMFPAFEVDSITNGIHAATWCAQPFRELFDRYLPGWREDNFSLRGALSIPPGAIWEAHQTCKRQLMDRVNSTMNAGLDPDTFTLGFARRAAPYKRADLLIRDVPRLKRIAAKAGRIQVVYAGKSHPANQAGKELIQRVIQARAALLPEINLVYLPDYQWELGALITAGVDVWLNTPRPPREASGTSGMKAALNGVPNLSILDGWWIEGCAEDVTGWAIGEPAGELNDAVDRSPQDAESLYQKLETVVLPKFYQDRNRFIRMMAFSIALNGSFFNTQRMVQEYVLKAYFV